jgi:hypothetical protein
MTKSYFSKVSGVSVVFVGLLALGACNSLTECQKYFPVSSEALQCQRGADEIAPLVKQRYSVLPEKEKAEGECRSLCAEDLGGFSGALDGEGASLNIDLQVACVQGCRGRIEYDRVVSEAADGCEQVRVAGGTIRCI